MTTATISVTQDQVFTALGDFVDSLGFTVPNAQGGAQPIECVVLPTNRAPMPANAFISISPAAQTRLATNRETYDGELGTRASMMQTQQAVQVDCYGPTSGDWANILLNLLRSAYGCDWFAQNNDGVAVPLYADDSARQVPLVDGEDQYEQRWTFNCMLQFNPDVTLGEQFATKLGPVTLIDVDTLK